MTDIVKLTKQQRRVLEAMCAHPGMSPYSFPVRAYGKGDFEQVVRNNGAYGNMIENLISRGLLSRWQAPGTWAVTSKGLLAIGAPTSEIAAREAVEAQLAREMAKGRDLLKAKGEEREAKRRAKIIAKVRMEVSRLAKGVPDDSELWECIQRIIGIESEA